MKEVIGKDKLVILNNKNIFDQKTIANNINEYFVSAGRKLVCKIPQLQRSFEMYVKTGLLKR